MAIAAIVEQSQVIANVEENRSLTAALLSMPAFAEEFESSKPV
jgi:hypothetical protein